VELYTGKERKDNRGEKRRSKCIVRAKEKQRPCVSREKLVFNPFVVQ